MRACASPYVLRKDVETIRTIVTLLVAAAMGGAPAAPGRELGGSGVSLWASAQRPTTPRADDPDRLDSALVFGQRSGTGAAVAGPNTHGDVGRADVVPELVLARVPEEEAVELDVARAKARAVIVRLESPNLDRHGRSQSLPSTGFPAIRSRSALLGLRGLLTRSDTFSKDSDVSTNRDGITMSAGSSRSA